MGVQLVKKVMLQAAAIALIALLAGLAVNSVRADGIPLVRNGDSVSNDAADYTGVNTIAPDEAERLHRTGAVVFVDARSQWEYEEGHIAGAVSMPEERASSLPEAFRNAVPAEMAIITYCDGAGCHLSKDLAMHLQNQGYHNVRVLIDGWGVWRRRGLPIEKAAIGKKAERGGNS